MGFKESVPPWALRLGASCLGLSLLGVVMAAVLRASEAPGEITRIDAMTERNEFYSEIIMNKLFRFYFIPTALGCPDTFSCNECNDHLHEVGLPGTALAPDWFMAGHEVWFHRNDTSVWCKGYDSDTDCDLRVCSLKLPSTTQINACLDPQPINPLFYNQTCLQNSIDCPNCDKVQGYLESLDFEPDPHSPTGVERYMTRASVYEPYKRSIEEYAESNLVPHWTWPGCFYFALTILTTIGYGNFAPSTVPSKIVRNCHHAHASS